MLKLRLDIAGMIFAAFALTLSADGIAADFLTVYKGIPYVDSRYTGGAQAVPGRVQCAYYDLGGEGIAYHDTTFKNEGSGGLNPADGSYLNEFRKNEGVDTSYTKFHDAIDNNPYGMVKVEENQLYVGWTQPGEWFNITVDATHAGVYSADLLYTSNRGGMIALDVNGASATEPIHIISTYNPADPIAWRQWHHWNMMHDAVKVKLNAGKNVLTVHILTEGNMNLAWFQFVPVPV
ncbi:carbohydrate-binding protein [Acidicapsa ligni]|uniref:hypothetical protein n=1 Tax=Acidicapsa ligni TaxID=542300 RepID=UPI0021DF4E8F|nr:hypothetical protein [Acidicapsa ligni]